MNKILDKKININMINIISEYLSPNIKYIKMNNLKCLIGETTLIYQCIKLNICLCKQGMVRQGSLKNGKFKRITENGTKMKYWVIIDKTNY